MARPPRRARRTTHATRPAEDLATHPIGAVLTRIEFTVPGEPQPQGSKTTVVRKGKPPVVRDDNPDTKPWRTTVAAQALQAMGKQQPLTGPLELHALFVFGRPASHFGTGRNADTLKPSAPAYCWTRPDLDKLLRAIGDAMTGIVYRDDARIVITKAEKHYGNGHPYAHIVVSEVELEEANSEL